MSDEKEIDYDPNINDAVLRVYELQKAATFLEDHGESNGMPKHVVEFLIDNMAKECQDIGVEVAKCIDEILKDMPEDGNEPI